MGSGWGDAGAVVHGSGWDQVQRVGEVERSVIPGGEGLWVSVGVAAG